MHLLPSITKLSDWFEGAIWCGALDNSLVEWGRVIIWASENQVSWLSKCLAGRLYFPIASTRGFTCLGVTSNQGSKFKAGSGEDMTGVSGLGCDPQPAIPALSGPKLVHFSTVWPIRPHE